MSRNFADELITDLRHCAARLSDARLPGELATEIERLAKQVDEPCVLAVVGRMKAGKSTFINALLGEDVAKVGVTETTATINMIRYGTPPDLHRPIRCHWRGGRHEDVTREFLDSLQGNTAETLQRAEGIEYLEYHLPNPYLQEVTLVDTPGTAAVVDEHQNRLADFLNLQRQMRERQSEATQHYANGADAVIYLVGQVARAPDKELLQEFTQATGGQSKALNAIGVMAKIDLQPEILTRRHELAAKIADHLKESLNTVVPVSAGIRRALDQLQKDDNKALVHLTARLRQIPPSRLQKLLDSDELYEMDFEDCPVTVDERRQLRGDMPWGVFTTIARLAPDPQLTGHSIVQQLDDMAGFGPLKEVLDRHFFKRARFLRCYRILNDARKILSDIRYKHLPTFRQKDRDDQAQRDRFVDFIRGAQGNPGVAKELEEFIKLICGTAGRASRLEATLKDLDRKLGRLYHEMEEHNADFEALGVLEKNQQLFKPGELEEMRPLLGLYGVETEKRLPPGRVNLNYAAERQRYWIDVRLRARDAARRSVAERAEARYGLILGEISQAKAKT